MHHILEADGIQLSFGRKSILSDVYLKCETGIVTGLLGRNGQGKSSLLKVIFGTQKAYARSVRMNGIPVKAINSGEVNIVYLPQFHFVPGRFTLERVFRDYGITFSEFADSFPEYQESYALPINKLSGGTQRLIELYITIKAPSKFVLLDEPFTHLSPLLIEKVKALLQIEKEHKGFLITDHMYRQVLDVCDKIYVLANSKTHFVKEVSDIEWLGYAKV